jgi:peroxiredoxin
MDKNDDMLANAWVDERLAKLSPDSEWQPDVARALDRFGELRATATHGPRRWIVAAAAIVTTALGLSVFHTPRAFAQRCVGACESLFLGRAHARRAPGTVDGRQPAPDFLLKDASGATVRLSDYRGKVVVMNFWATWCAPCQAEIPWFIGFERRYAGRGLAVIGISMDEDGWKSVKPWIDARQVNYRIVIGDEALAREYGGVEALPETLLIDRAGRIAARHVGIVKESEYEGEIRQILNEN